MQAIKVFFTFNFDKKPMFSNEQKILVRLDKHWIVYAYELQENGRYRGNEKFGHWSDYEVPITIDHSKHFDKDLKGKGYVLLIPRNQDEVKEVQTSAISIEYHFDGYLKNFKKVDSTLWKNDWL